MGNKAELDFRKGERAGSEKFPVSIVSSDSISAGLRESSCTRLHPMIISKTAARQIWIRTADSALDERCHIISVHRLEAQNVRGYGVSLIAAA